MVNTPYDFDRVIDRRGTSSLKWDYGRKFTGRDALLPLWVADMDFEAPPEIRAALARRAQHGIYGYTLEPESLFEAAQLWLQGRHGWSVRRDWMLSSPGVIPCLSAAILALTEPGEGIIIQPPVYHPFATRITANGRRVVENPLRLTGDRWEIDFEDLPRRMDQRTRMLILCSPHNPVSRVWSREDLERLVDLCVSRNVIIVSDEIHCDLVMSGFRHIPVASLSDEASRRVVTLVAATKTFNLAGLGGSLAIVADSGMRRRLDAAQRAIFTGACNAFAAAASEAAWRSGRRWLDELLAYVEENYRFTVSFLARRLPAVRAFPLEGTYLALLDMRALGLSDDELTDRLQREGGVWLDEGRRFGSGGQGLERLNLACPRAILSDGLERVALALAPSARAARRGG
ncbi:MAG TPA: PatB family C-S lyase [Spirochaetia bacterium]|nr:PatB family C-S lyase [Spirochaetia bacterium]